MDDLDAMIMREIVWMPADPHHAARGMRRPWDIARALGLHGTTIKRRLAAMREEGALLAIHLQPAPALVQRHATQHHFVYRDAASKQRAFEAMQADPSVWEAYSFVGKELTAVVATPEHEAPQRTVERLAAETDASSHRFHHTIRWNTAVERVSALDLRILAAYADDAFRHVSDVAAEVGIAPKTVTSRMKTLAKLGAFLVHPLIDYRRTNGGMTVYLDLTLGLGASDAVHVELANRFPLAPCRTTRGAEHAYVVAHVADAEQVEDVVSRAEAIPGVERVEPRLLHVGHREPARWKDALLQRAEALARAKGLWAPAWRATPSALNARP